MKSELEGDRPVAHNATATNSNQENLFQFVDKRSSSLVQRKTQAMASRFLGAGGIATKQAGEPQSSKTIQRAVIQFGKPDIKKRVAGSRKAGKFSHKRSATAFGAVNKKKSGLQGPHRIAHITTSVMLDTMLRHGESPLRLLGTRVIPRPRINNAILSRSISGVTLTPARRKKMVKYQVKYRKMYEKAEKGDEKAAEKCIELSAPQTYNLDSGTATSDEMAGKGERRGAAADDLEKGYKWSKTKFDFKGVKTFDPSGIGAKEKRKQALRFRQFARATAGDDLSDGESEGSEDEGMF